MVGFVLFSANLSIASQRQLVYEHIDVQMVLNSDTSIDVEETQRVRLTGDWNGLYRNYLQYGCDGIEIIDISENDTIYKRGSVRYIHGYIVEQEKGAVKVKWRSRKVTEPPYRDKTTTFKIRYRIIGAVAQYHNRDVLYWKPLFQDREHPVNQASVTLVLPEAVEADRLETVFYTKAFQAKWHIDPRDKASIHFSGQQINPKDKFEIKVSLPKGVLQAYSSSANTYFFHIKPWVFPVGVTATAFILFVIWFLFGNDPVPDPHQLSNVDVFGILPGLAGILIDESFDTKDVSATIIDLGRRGYIRIKEIEKEQGFESGSYEFKLVKVPPDKELTDYEDLLIRKLFSDKLVQGRKVTTDQLENKFYVHIPEIKKKAWQEVKTLGWFETLPEKAQAPFFVFAVIATVISLILTAIENAPMIIPTLAGVFFAAIPGAILVSNLKHNGFKNILKNLFFLILTMVGFGL